MSQRMSAHVALRIRVDGGESPNNFFPQLTVDMRVFWPPFTVTEEQVMEAVEDAISALRVQIQQRVANVDSYPRNTWLAEP